MAIDLLVHSMKLPSAGRLETCHVAPVVGADAFGRSGRITLPLEFFYDATMATIFLQQRSPILLGHANEWAEALVAWCQEQGIENLLFLVSCDARFLSLLIIYSAYSYSFLLFRLRFTENQMRGVQLRYTSTKPGEKKCNITPFAVLTFSHITFPALPWPDLEPDSLSEAFKRGTPSERIWRLCEEKGIYAEALIIFCSEGLNIPEAETMACLRSYTFLIRSRLAQLWHILTRSLLHSCILHHGGHSLFLLLSTLRCLCSHEFSTSHLFDLLLAVIFYSRMRLIQDKWVPNYWNDLLIALNFRLLEYNVCFGEWQKWWFLLYFCFCIWAGNSNIVATKLSQLASLEE